jgi:hypothetical protein
MALPLEKLRYVKITEIATAQHLVGAVLRSATKTLWHESLVPEYSQDQNGDTWAPPEALKAVEDDV